MRRREPVGAPHSTGKKGMSIRSEEGTEEKHSGVKAVESRKGNEKHSGRLLGQKKAQRQEEGDSDKRKNLQHRQGTRNYVGRVP